MSTIAELKLIVDSSQLEQAKKALDEFNDSAKKIGKGITGGDTAAYKKTTEEVDGLTKAQQRLVDKANEMVATFGQSSGAVLAYKADLAGVGHVVKPLADTLDKLKAAQKDSLITSRESASALKKEATEKERLASAIRLEAETYGMSRHQKMLYKAEQVGLTAETSAYVAKLKELVAAQEAADSARKSNVSQSRADNQAKLNDLAKEKAENTALLEQSTNRANMERQLVEYERQKAETRQKGLNRDTESQEIKNIVDANKQLEAENRKVAASTDQIANEFQKLRSQIDPVKGAYEKLYAQIEKLEQLKRKSKGNANLVDPKEVAELEKTINRNIASLDKLGATTGKTAKEMAFSMRGLPAQFTDVVVSLQGGQKPLTVLLQQGGQVKDMFGGIVPAFKAMGTYVMGLITPLNLLIAGIGLFAYTTYSGVTELDSFRKAVILTGNSSKISTKEMAEGARSVAASYGTIGKATEVMTKVATTTKVHKDNILAVTEATMKWADATGGSVEDVLAEYAKLGTASGVEELQAKYTFLTSETRRYADEARMVGGALAEQAVYEKALAEAQSDRVDRTRASNSGISLTYAVLTETIAKLFDKMKEGGRSFADLSEESEYLQNKAKSLKETISGLENTLKYMPDSVKQLIPAFFGLDAALLASQNELKKTEDAMAALGREADRQAAIPYEKIISGLGTAFEKVVDPAFALERQLEKTNKMITDIESSDIGRTEDLNKAIQVRLGIERQLYDLRKNSLSERQTDDSEKALRLATEQYNTVNKISSSQATYNRKVEEFLEIEEKVTAGVATRAEIEALANKNAVLSNYKKIVGLQAEHDMSMKANKEAAKTVTIRDSAAEKMLVSMKQTEASLKEQLSSDVKLGTEAKKLAELKEKLSILESESLTKKLTLENQSLLANKDALLTQQSKLVELEKELKIKEDLKQVETYKQGLDASLQVEKDRIQDAQTMLGLSDKQKEKARERNNLDREYAKTRLEMENSKVSSGISDEAYEQKLSDLKEYYAQRKMLLEDYYAFETEQADNWQAGFAEGLANFVDNQATMFETIRETTEETLSAIQEGIAQNLTQAIMYGDDLRESFHALKLTIMEGVLKALIQLGLQFGINAAKEAMGITTVAAVKKATIVSTAAVANTAATTSAGVQAGAAATTTAAWTPAAIMSSIGSFGTAAAIGLAAVVAAMAFGKGFKSGGYTGNGGTSDVAGVVHGKEFVFDANATSRIGIDNLENIRKGGSYSQGGGGNISTNNSRSTSVTQVFNVTGEVDNRTSAQMASDAGNMLSMAQRFA